MFLASSADKRNTQMEGDDWDYGDGTYSINWDGHDAQVVQDFRCTVTEVAGEIRAMVQANKTVEMRALIASFGEEVADITPFTLLLSPFTLRVSPFTFLMPSTLSHSYSSSLRLHNPTRVQAPQHVKTHACPKTQYRVCVCMCVCVCIPLKCLSLRLHSARSFRKLRNTSQKHTCIFF